MPPGSGFHRVDCRKIHCSWHRPTHTAWLNFGSKNIAGKVHDRFNAGVYKVLGLQVKANGPTGQGNRWNPRSWTVTLADLPSTAQVRDINQAIPEFHKPHHVEMGKTSYHAALDTATTIVKSMLLEIGPLEWWDVSASSKGKRIKAQARFLEEPDAREAASSLNNKPLSLSKTARLTVQLMTSAKFKVSSRIHDGLREQLETQKMLWESQHIHFIAYPPQQGHRVLKLESENSQLVAEAKKSLECIIAGEVLSKDGKDLWNPNLKKNGDEFQRLKQLEREYNVVILRDRRRSQLRLFGPRQSYRPVTEALEALLRQDNLTSNSQVVELNSDEFQWACRGGFKTLASRLGDNKAIFDIISTPKRILISGSTADYTAALVVISSRQTGKITDPSNIPTDCSVCWTEAEDPIQTSCNHVYCTGCFADLCQAEGSASTEFHLSCVGDEGRCEKFLPLTELQELLSFAALEDVLEASFASHVRRHPADFRFCSTPDCGHLYRPAAEGTSPAPVFTCTNCLIPTCAACHVPHPDMTCAGYKDLASGGYEALEEIKKRLGIKDCPKCKTAMEKTEGCNHMTCRGCGIHICWVCLAIFGIGSECYAHLNKVHRGIFDGYERFEE
ncbi:putative uncharacterized protein, chloroplastic [Tolypocladium ophioglossoides CBS 100239]|uniref:RING-type domain-containing protein n=1 Tax=Tolypocladium ophioglossoides (strain CBS 100239) TaxID=1163406 RepID=A0A0L0MZS6_TOLOC|nr:putative uncharacterized protein, chloroplastic [Tolypocladium ophioglossoides CBS 100239]